MLVSYTGASSALLAHSLFGLHFDAEDGGNMFLTPVNFYQTIVSDPRKLYSSQSQSLKEPQNLKTNIFRLFFYFITTLTCSEMKLNFYVCFFSSREGTYEEQYPLGCHTTYSSRSLLTFLRKTGKPRSITSQKIALFTAFVFPIVEMLAVLV
jgi:hypothetical protein